MWMEEKSAYSLPMLSQINGALGESLQASKEQMNWQQDPATPSKDS